MRYCTSFLLWVTGLLCLSTPARADTVLRVQDTTRRVLLNDYVKILRDEKAVLKALEVVFIDKRPNNAQ